MMSTSHRHLAIFSCIIAYLFANFSTISGAKHTLGVSESLELHNGEILESSNRRFRFLSGHSSSFVVVQLVYLNHSVNIWAANNNYLTAAPAARITAITMNENGRLEVYGRGNSDVSVIFTVNSEQEVMISKTRATLLDNGNLVLRSRSGRTLWQSFDYPSDHSWISSGMKFGISLLSQRNTTCCLQRAASGPSLALGPASPAAPGPSGTLVPASGPASPAVPGPPLIVFDPGPASPAVPVIVFDPGPASPAVPVIVFDLGPASPAGPVIYPGPASPASPVIYPGPASPAVPVIYPGPASSPASPPVPVIYPGPASPAVPGPPPGRNKSKNSKVKLYVVVASVSIFLVALALLFLCCKLRKKRGFDREFTGLERPEVGDKGDDESLFFSLISIEIATNNFSDQNKLGQGGFGPVYKGKLDNGLEIAVKRLNRISRHGIVQFKNEVTVISKLQHRNLVRLLGYCIEREERLLIYEYLPNNSLESILFDAAKKDILDWKRRLKIIEGVAQGLLYLHKYSRLKIIHRDLKTSNVLLDNDLNPKISDFGTARIFGDDEIRANTNTIVGTYGYMSPEYAMDGIFSEKSDVFSFGVMILEIISGKKNTSFYDSDRHLNLIGHVWDLWTEGRILEILDSCLGETVSKREAQQHVQVGLLCVQEKAGDRPIMSDVVSMLLNESMILAPPKRPAFAEITSLNSTKLPENPEVCSVSKVTISDVEGR